jgi:hypothetical protein
MDLLLIIISFIILIIIITYTGIELKNYITNNIKYSTTGCLYKRWGCCPDKLTTKLDPQGSNCRGF